MATTVEQIQIKTDLSGLEEAVAEIAKLQAGIRGLPKGQIGPEIFSSGQKAVAKEVVSELQQQARLEAQIAGFDAQRARNIAALKDQLHSMNQEATGQKESTPLSFEGQVAIQGLQAGLQAIKQIYIEIASAVAQIAEAGVKLAISSSAFRENTEKSFGFLLGSSSKAKDLYEKALDVADQVGLEKEQVVSKLKEMLLAGFGEKEAISAIEAAGNIAQVVGEEGAGQLLDVFKKIKAGGSFGAPQEKALKALGVNIADVRAALAANLGKSLAEVDAMLKAGKVGAEDGIAAIEKVINGKLGGAGDAAGQTFDRLFGDLKSNFARLFDGVDLGPLKDVMANILSLLKGPAGAEAKKAINEAFSAFSHIFDSFRGEEGKKRLEVIFSDVVKIISFTAKVLEKAGPVIVWVIDKIVAVMASNQGSGGGILATLTPLFGILTDIFTGGIAGIVAGVDNLARALAGLFGFDMSGVPSLWAMLSTIWDTITGFDLTGSGISVGESLIDGMVSGIEGGISRVISSAVSMATSAANAAKSALGINSPSRVFAGLGGHTADGFSMGIVSGIPDVRRAANDLADAAAGGASYSGGAPSTGGGGGGKSAGAVTVNVQHSSPPVTLPEGTTPAQAHALTSAAQAGDQEKFNRLLVVALRQVGAAA